MGKTYVIPAPMHVTSIVYQRACDERSIYWGASFELSRLYTLEKCAQVTHAFMQVASLFLRHGVRKRYATVKGVYTLKIHLLYASGSGC